MELPPSPWLKGWVVLALVSRPPTLADLLPIGLSSSFHACRLDHGMGWPPSEITITSYDKALPLLLCSRNPGNSGKLEPGPQAQEGVRQKAEARASPGRSDT